MVHADWWVKHRRTCRLVHQEDSLPHVLVRRVFVYDEEGTDADLLLAKLAEVAGQLDGSRPVYVCDLLGTYDDVFVLASDPISYEEAALAAEEVTT
jgi:hypothetical protein